MPYKGRTLMRDDIWFDNDNQKAIYNKYERYCRFFNALSHSNGYEGVGRGESSLSFSSYELELILMLRQVFIVDIKKDGYLLDLLEGFNQLAEWFKHSDQAIADCDYLFVQAYIAFIHEQINYYFSEEDLDATTQGNLLALARFSVDIAEFYANRSTGYKDVRLSSDRQYEYIEERDQNLYELLYSLSSLSANTKDKLISEIISTIKKEYLQQPPLDDDGFANLHEYLGYINYHGGDHFLYQTAIDELDNDIHCEVYHLPLPDMVTILEDDVYDIFFDADMKDISNLEEFRSGLANSDQFDQLLQAIKKEFMRGVPEYFPE